MTFYKPMNVQCLKSPSTLRDTGMLSVLSYNILLPNSEDGWWTYKMYAPNVVKENMQIAEWHYRQNLLKERIMAVDADIVCLQEVSPLSFEKDFTFMSELGYDGKEMFKKGRFRPATFWKSNRCNLVAPPIHKDRSLLTTFQLITDKVQQEQRNWFILNCHLQAGPQAPRRVRQINEGLRAVVTLAKKLKEPDPTKAAVIVCGDFNGGSECGAVRYLEDGFVDETFLEDGAPVSSGRKALPLDNCMIDVAASVDRPPPSTLVVSELISQMVKQSDDSSPSFSDAVETRLQEIFKSLATHQVNDTLMMNISDVERYLVQINGKLGRGSEFREAARQMGWKAPEDPNSKEQQAPRIELPKEGLLTFDGFKQIYLEELRQGKFWGIAYDIAVLGYPLPDKGVFQCRYDRMYCSNCIQPATVLDFTCSTPCPNETEPSDHLPVAASFNLK